MNAEHYSLTVNGASFGVRDAGVGESLLYVLRERLGLTGPKGACEEGECGSCSVTVDGVLVCSCLVLAAASIGRSIVTIEGIGEGAGNGVGKGVGAGDGLSDVQTAFVEAGAVQCGFCTPGLIMAAHSLLEANPDPTESELREALSGNICRCTGYGRIIEAVQRVAVRRRNSPAVGAGR